MTRWKTQIQLHPFLTGAMVSVKKKYAKIIYLMLSALYHVQTFEYGLIFNVEEVEEVKTLNL